MKDDLTVVCAIEELIEVERSRRCVLALRHWNTIGVDYGSVRYSGFRQYMLTVSYSRLERDTVGARVL